jgi:uncharacterized protein with HEPN domain
MSLMKYAKISFRSLERPGRNTGQIDPLYFGANLEVVWLSVKEGISEAKQNIKRILD